MGGSGRWRALSAALAVVLVAGGLAVTVTVSAPDAVADTAPAVASGLPATMSADALPTVQVNGVVWAQVTVGNTVYTITAADVSHGGNVVNTAVSTGTPPAGPPVTSDPSAPVVPLNPVAALTTEKSVVSVTDTNGDGRTDAGDVVHYKIVTTNTGNVSVADVRVADHLVAPAGPDPVLACTPGSPVAMLAVAAAITCTADYTITVADADNGKVVNTATATGSGVADSSTTGSVPSTPGMATITVEKPTPLAYTGNDSELQLIVAGMLIGVGCLLMMARRRRRLPARHGR